MVQAKHKFEFMDTINEWSEMGISYSTKYPAKLYYSQAQQLKWNGANLRSTTVNRTWQLKASVVIYNFTNQ